METESNTGIIFRLTRAFAEETSMHGVGKIASRRAVIRRVLWAVFSFTAFGVALYNIISVVEIFRSWPVSTVLTIEHNTKLSFPAVTLCNMNPIRLSQLQNDSIYEEIRYLRALLIDQGSSTGYITDLLDDFVEPDPDDQFKLSILIGGLMSHMTPEVRKQLGHQLPHMLLSCQHGAKACNESHFEYFYDNKYGNCYIFNADGNWVSTQSGPLYGLTLELYVQEEEYIGLLANTIGVKVLVTDQRDVPVPDDEGVVVGPGLDTYIGLSKREIMRTEPPHGNCEMTPTIEGAMDIIHAWGPRYNYSNRGCMKACIQIHTILQCGCCKADLPCTDDIVQDILQNTSASARKCSVPDGRTLSADATRDLACNEDVLSKYIEDHLKCSELCAPSCRETVFPKEVSAGLWPSSKIFSHIKDKIERTHGINFLDTNFTVSEDFIRHNTLKLHIFYQLLNHEIVSSRPSYDLENLISDIGGSAGLWLGFSVLTFLEIMELLIDIAISLLSKSSPARAYEGRRAKSALETGPDGPVSKVIFALQPS